MMGDLKRRHVAGFAAAGLFLLGTWAWGQPGKSAKADPAALKRADTAFRAGYAAMQGGRLEEARKDFAQAAKLAPKLPEAHGAIGAVLVQLGRPEEAIPELEKTLELEKALGHGDDATTANLALAHEALGQKLAGGGKLGEAVVQMKGALVYGAEPGMQAQLEDELGSLQAKQEHWAEAEAAFREALRLTPEGAAAANAHMHLGIALEEEKNPDESLTELSRAVELYPGGGMAQFQLGRLLALVGKDEEAVPHLQEACKANPAAEGADLELAMAEQRLGKQEESIPSFRRAVELAPHNATALTNLGLALTETGKAREALPFYQRALVETPNDPVVHEDLGVAYIQQSDFDGAITQFEKAQALHPDDPQVHYDLGLAYKLKDRMDDAVRELAKAGSLDPKLPDPPYTLGILYMQIGRLEEAVTQLRAALVLRPENGDGWAILGSVLKQLNRQEEAVVALRKAVELQPNQPGPHLTLAGALSELGKRDEATAERKVAAGLSRSAVNHQRATFNTNAGNQSLLRGEISEAVGRYKDAIAADPNFLEAHRQLAVAYARQGRAQEAADEQAKAAAIEAGMK